MRLDVPGAQSDAMSRYLSMDVFPRALALTGVVACHLYASDQDASHVRTAESNTREFNVPSWVLLAKATTLHAAEQVRVLIGGPELQRLGVTVRSDAAIYSLEICRLASQRLEPSGPTL
jgi:23S rRNA G2445 N2-methylase RlmL